VKKLMLSAMAAAVLFSLFGCHNRSGMDERLVPLKPMQQSYHGVLPCADCEGIDVSLFLEKDGTWVSNIRYIGGKTPGSYGNYGTWARTAEKLVLTDNKGMKTYLLARNEALEILDNSGKHIDSPFNHTLKATDMPLPTTPIAMKGMYRYMADTATFQDCATGRTFLMADNAQLERGFGGAAKPVLVVLKAHYIHMENPDTGAAFKALKADSDGRFSPGKGCDD
jgi:copper homeostasis protein (lipoprotein)